MAEPVAIVVGGGPAGVAAAARLAVAGVPVRLIDQRAALGGAIHRQPAQGAPVVPSAPSLSGQWARLRATLAASGAAVTPRCRFAGVDGTGVVLIEDRAASRMEILRPKALILACGAMERVRPRPGWELPGVVSAGGLQVMLKEGRLPSGRVLLAGSGPLLLALAAQMAARGAPPVAVVEEGDPLCFATAGLMAYPAVWRDMAALIRPILRGAFPWWRRTRLAGVMPGPDGLVATLSGPRGERRVSADIIALHDGIRPNDFGLPDMNDGPFILRAGDCRETLGALAAEADGLHAAEEALALLGHRPPVRPDPVVARQHRFQERLARVFAPSNPPRLSDLPDDTVICRCEGKRLGELRAFMAGADRPTPREVKLNGRFGMGVCQGRFCADWTLAAMSETGSVVPDGRRALTGARWPVLPVSLASLAGIAGEGGAPEKIQQSGGI